MQGHQNIIACSSGIVALWTSRLGTFYNPPEVSSSPLLFFVFEKEMLALLKTRVNGARYRSPEGSL